MLRTKRNVRRHNQFSRVELFDAACQREKFLRARLKTIRQSDDLRLARLFGDRLPSSTELNTANEVSCRFACSEDAKYRMEKFSSKSGPARRTRINAHIPLPPSN